MRGLIVLVCVACLGCGEAKTPPAGSTLTVQPIESPETEAGSVLAVPDLQDEILQEPMRGPDPVAMSIAGEPIYRYAAKCVTFSPDGRWLAIGYGDGKLRLWDRQEETVAGEWTAHNNWLFDLQFSADSQTLWTGGGDNRVRQWTVADGELVERFDDHEDDVHGVVVSADGKLLVSGADDHLVVIRDLQTDDVEALEGHAAQVTSIALSPDDTLIASGSRDGSARIWDVKTRKSLHELQTDDKHVLSVAFDHDGKRLITAGRDNAAHIWDVASGERLHSFPSHGKRVFTAIWLNGDEVIATGSQDRHLRLIRISDGETIADETMAANPADLALSPDGKVIAAAMSDGNVHLFDTDGLTLKPLTVIPPSEAQVKAVSAPPADASHQSE